MELNLFPTHCWFLVPKPEKSHPLYQTAKILSHTSSNYIIEPTENSQSPIELPITSLIPHMLLIQPTGFSNLLDLEYLNPAEILHNLRVRYENELIHTNVGSSLLIINPNQMIFSEYSEEKLLFFAKKLRSSLISHHFDELSLPHIFSKAALAYFSLIQNKRSQAILIQGVAGSGKTENTKFAMKFITSFNASETDLAKNSIEQKILNCIPILEAFGNARTLNNLNSSRFGNFIRILFKKDGFKLQGAIISSYLLEKGRISSKDSNERNYHIFYQILSGLDKELKEMLCMEPNLTHENFKYLKYNTEGLDMKTVTQLDNENFQKLLISFNQMGLSTKEIHSIYSILLAIIDLGNIEFEENNSVSNIAPLSKNNLEKISMLLKLDPMKLTDNLIYKTRIIEKEYIKSPLSLIECQSVKDSLARGMYDQLFNWLLKRLNLTIIPKNDLNESPPLRISLQVLRESLSDPASDKLAIGLLDIFGFENLISNGFEQFCINFLSERLHQLYLEETFKSELKIFQEEPSNFPESSPQFIENQPLLDLFEKFPLGIFQLLDESTALASNDDRKLLEKIVKTHKDDANFIKPKTILQSFGISHNGVPVEYNILGFRSKNKDEIPKELQETIEESDNVFISSIFRGFCGFETDKISDHENKIGETGLVSNRSKTDKYLGAKFRAEIKQLIDELSTYDVTFVRCLKANMENISKKIDSELVLSQLHALEILETAKLKKQGFFYKRKYIDFIKEFGLLKKMKEQSEDRKLVEDLLGPLGKELFYLGESRVFIKYEGIKILEEEIRKLEFKMGKRIFRWMKSLKVKAKLNEKVIGNVILEEKINLKTEGQDNKEIMGSNLNSEEIKVEEIEKNLEKKKKDNKNNEIEENLRNLEIDKEKVVEINDKEMYVNLERRINFCNEGIGQNFEHITKEGINQELINLVGKHQELDKEATNLNMNEMNKEIFEGNLEERNIEQNKYDFNNITSNENNKEVVKEIKESNNKEFENNEDPDEKEQKAIGEYENVEIYNDSLRQIGKESNNGIVPKEETIYVEIKPENEKIEIKEVIEQNLNNIAVERDLGEADTKTLTDNDLKMFKEIVINNENLEQNNIIIQEKIKIEEISFKNEKTDGKNYETNSQVENMINEQKNLDSLEIVKNKEEIHNQLQPSMEIQENILRKNSDTNKEIIDQNNEVQKIILEDIKNEINILEIEKIENSNNKENLVALENKVQGVTEVSDILDDPNLKKKEDLDKIGLNTIKSKEEISIENEQNIKNMANTTTNSNVQIIRDKLLKDEVDCIEKISCILSFTPEENQSKILDIPQLIPDLKENILDHTFFLENTPPPPEFQKNPLESIILVSSPESNELIDEEFIMQKMDCKAQNNQKEFLYAIPEIDESLETSLKKRTPEMTSKNQGILLREIEDSVNDQYLPGSDNENKSRPEENVASDKNNDNNEEKINEEQILSDINPKNNTFNSPELKDNTSDDNNNNNDQTNILINQVKDIPDSKVWKIEKYLQIPKYEFEKQNFHSETLPRKAEIHEEENKGELPISQRSKISMIKSFSARNAPLSDRVHYTQDIKLEAEIEKISLEKLLKKSLLINPKKTFEEPAISETLVDALNEFMDIENSEMNSIEKSKECLEIINSGSKKSLTPIPEYLPDYSKDNSLLDLFLNLKSSKPYTNINSSPFSSDLNINLNNLDPEFLKSVLSHPFIQFCEKHLPKHTTWTGKIIPINEWLVFSKKRTFNITPLSKINEKHAQKCFKIILAYLLEKEDDKAIILAKELLESCFEANSMELINEIFLEIIKQTSKCPDEVILLKAGILLLIFSSFFRPSTVFLLPFLHNLYTAVQTNQKNDENKIIRAINRACFMRILRIYIAGNRKNAPRVKELKILSHLKKIVVPIVLPNNWDHNISIPIEAFTTVFDAKMLLLKFLELELNYRYFGLFLCMKRNDDYEEIFLDEDELYMDILDELEIQKEDFEQRVTQGKKKGFNRLWFFDYRITLKIRFFFKLNENDIDAVNFYYLQTHGNFINGCYPATEPESFHLITMAFLISYGNRKDIPLEFKTLSKVTPRNFMKNMKMIIENVGFLLEKYEIFKKNELKLKFLEFAKRYDRFMSNEFSVYYYEINQKGEELNAGNYDLVVKPLEIILKEDLSGKTFKHYNLTNITDCEVKQQIYLIITTDDEKKHIVESIHSKWIECLLKNYGQLAMIGSK